MWRGTMGVRVYVAGGEWNRLDRSEGLMPTRPLRPCAQPGCPALVQAGRCPVHGGTGLTPRGWATPSVTAPLRLRGRAWVGIRQEVLMQEPCCYLCDGGGTEADYVDHVVPLAEGGTDDRWNLRRICRDCHARKTGRESTRARRG